MEVKNFFYYMRWVITHWNEWAAILDSVGWLFASRSLQTAWEAVIENRWMDIPTSPTPERQQTKKNITSEAPYTPWKSENEVVNISEKLYLNLQSWKSIWKLYKPLCDVTKGSTSSPR